MEVLLDSKCEIRNNKFQSTFNLEKLRRNREKGLIQLRKQKRNQQIAKKRALNIEKSSNPDDLSMKNSEFLIFDISWISPDLSVLCPSLADSSLTPADRLSKLISYILSLEDLNALYDPIQTLRKILSSEGVPPVHSIMSTGVSAKLISLLNCSNLSLQKECLWCVLNLATGPPYIVKMLMDQDVLSALTQLLKSADPDILELCVWCIGNLAGDSVPMRDQLINLVPSLIELLGKLDRERCRNIVWTLSNLCKGKPLPERQVTDQILAVIPSLLNTLDEEIVSDSCWALSYISDGDSQRVQSILDLNLPKVLIELLGHESTKVSTPCLRTLGNILTGSEEQAQQVLNLGFVDKAAVYLSSKILSLKREVLWTFSNITAGSDEQINLILTHPCINLVVEALRDPDFEIKKEALWTISNVTYAKSPSLVLKVIDLKAFPLLCEILDMKDSRVLLVVLEAINNILKAGASGLDGEKGTPNNEVAIMFDEIGGLSKMEELQRHPNVKIYKKVIEIMDEHYGLIELTDENEPPGPEVFSFN